jgi:sugar lactone lactonase YvrE
MYTAGVLLLSCGLLVLSRSADAAVAPLVSTLSAISEGTATPVRVAADQAGNLYVTDTRGGGVLKYNSAGSLLQKIGITGKKLHGIAISPKSGEILVGQESSVAVYSSSGVKKTEFGTFGAANGIAVDDTGTIFVVDSKNNTVVAFDGTNYSAGISFGVQGSSTGQFNQPTGITFEKISKQLAVVDTLNGRVQFFTTAGVYQKTVGSSGAGPLKFTSPQAIAFEYSTDGTALNRLYVVDSFQATVQVIDAATSAFLRYIGSYGTGGGQLVTPGDVLFDSFRRLIIPNGTGSLVLFGISDPVSTASGGTAITFPSQSGGSGSPALTPAPAVMVPALPHSGSTVNNPILTITGSVSDSSATSVTITVNGTKPQTVPVNDGLFSTLIVLGSGTNSILISSTDAAGNSSTPITRSVSYNPLAPIGTVAVPRGIVINTSSTSYTLSGTAPANSVVSVNGDPATLTGTQWTASIRLLSGLNPIVVLLKDPVTGVTSTLSRSVTYSPGYPSLAVTIPAADGATAHASPLISGTASTDAVVTASQGGVTLPVTVASDGSFTVLMEPFTAAGTYQVVISAIDATGKISSTTRSFVYDPTPAQLSVVDSATASIKISSSNGIVIARDKNGIVSTPSNGSAALDLSGAPFDPATLNIEVLTATGLSSRNGDINGDGTVDIKDALLAAQISLGAATATFEQLLRGDVGPMVNHTPLPDGKIRLDDVILILKKSVGSDW